MRRSSTCAVRCAWPGGRAGKSAAAGDCIVPGLRFAARVLAPAARHTDGDRVLIADAREAAPALRPGETFFPRLPDRLPPPGTPGARAPWAAPRHAGKRAQRTPLEGRAESLGGAGAGAPSLGGAGGRVCRRRWGCPLCREVVCFSRTLCAARPPGTGCPQSNSPPVRLTGSPTPTLCWECHRCSGRRAA